VSAGWCVIEIDAHLHVIPIADSRDHQCKSDCWCKPTLDEHVVVHHAHDQREQSEGRLQ